VTDVICDLPIDERPRERMFRHGPELLSDAELVAILLGSGVPGKNAIQLARALLTEGMTALSRRESSAFLRVHGVGPAKTARVLAAVELSRRIAADRPDELPEYDSHTLGSKLVSGYSRHTQERLGAAFLDSRHGIMFQREIYVGTINNALVATRDIVRYALIENASAVVVYHNHPSGNPQPSAEDMLYTEKLRHSLSLVDLELVDHLIIGSHRFHSMMEKGQMGAARGIQQCGGEPILFPTRTRI
jgi:DNA repair protein RadC